MKAVIMAGGEGRRLRAVSGGKPKPMVELLGRPILEHIVLLLKEQGFDELCMSLKYKADEIRQYFGSGERFGVRISYRVESAPLGTAGGVKNCADFYGGEPFLVISGDAVCDFDLASLMARHKAEAPAVTIALQRHPSPLSYGLTVTDSEGLVRCFIEKPDWPRVVSDLVNTGVYIISPGVMDCVPRGQCFDFARELFPMLLERGDRLLGVCMEGYWCDVGSPLSYYRCCVDALEGRLKLDMAGGFTPSASDNSGEEGDGGIDCPCRSRAALMGALSEVFLDMGADYSDGIRLRGENYRMHISPRVSRSAVRISVESPDAEFARRLAFSTRELAEAFDL